MLKALLTKYFPALFGKTRTGTSSNTYKLSHVHERVQSKPWQNNKNFQSRAEYEADETSSQEEIFGIQRKTEVSVTTRGIDSPRGLHSPMRLDTPGVRGPIQFTQYPIKEDV